MKIFQSRLMVRVKYAFLIHLPMLFLTLNLLDSVAEARVTRIRITSRGVIANGVPFESTGPYEKLRGTVFFEVDPNDPHNSVVFDLDKAPRNSRGMVEFSADFMIIKPVTLALGNHELFFEVNNRGRLFSLALMNDIPPDGRR